MFRFLARFLMLMIVAISLVMFPMSAMVHNGGNAKIQFDVTFCWVLSLGSLFFVCYLFGKTMDDKR